MQKKRRSKNIPKKAPARKLPGDGGKRAAGLRRSARRTSIKSSAVLKYLHECDGPQKLATIISALAPRTAKQHKSDAADLRTLIEAMVAEGQLVVTRRDEYGPAAKMDLIVGRVIGHADGFGFLSPDDGTEDLSLNARQMRQLLHGDRIVARVGGIDRRGRRMGETVEVLERANQQVVGRYFKESGVGFVVPDNKRIHQDILIPREHTAAAVHGQIVVADIDKQPDTHTQPIGRISEILGEHLAPGVETDVAIRAFDLPHIWSDEVIQETSLIPQEVRSIDRKGREDLRDIPLVTIDGEDARDFDDAVFCRRDGSGWVLLVAIADVSHYVKDGTLLDGAARERGTSTYFANRVVPMLPHELSNGICSLNPHVDRLCMVCELKFDEDGVACGSRFFEAVMRSAERFTYTDVAKILEQRDPTLREQHSGLVGHLDELYRLYKKLTGQREKRGALGMDKIEPRFVFDEHGKIAQILATERNDAHKLIEECMIAANVAAAEHLREAELSVIYRIHELPAGEKIEDLRTFLAELGLRVPGRGSVTPQEFSALLKSIQGRPDQRLIQTVILRSMRLAVYSTEEAGHFGLALQHYAHFTSPIRRYPDLMVHRAIRHTMNKRKHAYPRESDLVRLLADQCSTLERRADEAGYYAAAWLKCEYMLDKVGEVFQGTVSAVTAFGLFVELDGIFIEGLVHVTTMTHDYYHFDPIRHRLTGERAGGSFRIGQQVEVKLARVSLEERRIDLELVDKSPRKTPKNSARKTARKNAGKSSSKRSGKSRKRGS
jgi:ribonuclease R